MSHTSATAGREAQSQSSYPRLYRAMGEEIDRLASELDRAHAQIARSNLFAQESQTRAEEAERRAEKAERRAEKDKRELFNMMYHMLHILDEEFADVLRLPHETTSACKKRVLKLGEPSDLRDDAIPRLAPDSSPLPEIPAASTTPAVSDAPQTETESFRGHWPGAEPVEVQSAVRDRDVHSPSAGTTGNSSQGEEQPLDAIPAHVATRKRSTGIPTAMSQTRGKYWPRGRI